MDFFQNKINQFNYFKNILEKKEFINSIILFFLMMTSMLLEILILNYILNILNFFSGRNSDYEFFDSHVFRLLEPFFNKEIIILLFFALLFFIKSLFIIFVSKKENKFLANLRANVSNKLFSGYMKMPLIFKMRANTSDLIKNITNEVDFFISTVYSFCVITMEVLLLVGISIFLLVYNFKISIIAIFLFLSAGILFNLFNKKKISKLGGRRSTHLEKRVESIIEGLSGFKDIKIFGTFNAIKNNFEFHNNQISKINYTANFRNSLSKPFFELFIVVLVFLFVFYTNLNSNNVSDFVPTIGIFLVASYRLIPSLSRTVSSLQRIQFNFPSASRLNNDFVKFKNLVENNNEENPKKFNLKKSIRFENVSFSYKIDPKNQRDFILKDLNLEVIKGQKIGISGISGVGKSTFLDLFLGFYEPNKGSILVDGEEISKCKNSWQKIVSCVPQEIFIKNDSFLNNITFGKELSDMGYLREIIKIVGLDDLVSNMNEGLDTILGASGFKLSPGQQQRLALGRAIFFKPEILVLDESTSSLDSFNESKIVENIVSNKNKITVLWVSHNKEIFKNFDKCYDLKNGNFSEIK